MTPHQVGEQLRTIEDPATREYAARDYLNQVAAVCRAVRAEALRDLHRHLGSWEKVGEAIGLSRQDTWRASRR